jgi:hypothetical protein
MRQPGFSDDGVRQINTETPSAGADCGCRDRCAIIVDENLRQDTPR